MINDTSYTKVICIFVDLEVEETTVEKQTHRQDTQLQPLKYKQYTLLFV